MIAIVDYGMGNLRSVEKAFQFLGFEARVVDAVEELDRASHVVLPGDAAFGDAMANLRRGGWDEGIRRAIQAGRPFLGICVGLQLMFEESEELGRHQGLGLLPGRCRRFPPGQPVPQIGWNQVSVQQQHPLLAGVPEGSFFYFVHSYYVEADRRTDCLATTEYGLEYTSIAGGDRVVGVQFHPEKSQDVGLRLLGNFASMG
ncbi:MAG: imidazole glycerol phosphate synthase subunit HisH [Candidatus Latescibacterota bacterium]